MELAVASKVHWSLEASKKMHCFNTRKIIRISGSVNAHMYKYIQLRGLCCFLSSYPTLRHVSASWCVYPVHDRRPDTRSAVAAWSVLHQQLTPKMSQRKIKNMFFSSTNAKNFLHLKGKFWPPRCSLSGASLGSHLAIAGSGPLGWVQKESFKK